jgi:hypothetical protein
MKKSIYIWMGLWVGVVLCWQCKSKYVSPYLAPNLGYLVVEGFISGNAPIQYTLSRTLPLPGDSTITKEAGAVVEVEGSDNSSIPLIDQGGGIYNSVDTPGLNALIRYRLRVHTAGGEDYLSDFVSFRTSPPIDSINWVNGPTGVTIFANTHDPANGSHYYEWSMRETWEYHSAQESDAVYDSATGQVVSRPASSDVYTCWHDGLSPNILLGNTLKLASDVVYEQPLRLLPANGVELSVLYTTLVTQWVLTDSAYNYASIMQKNSETLGSIFDAQPSQLVSNIHCLTTPGKQVIGYISAGTVQQQRIWIGNAAVPGWNYVYACPDSNFIVSADSAIERYQFFYFGEVPLFQAPPPAKGWVSNGVGCIDCRAQGGTLYKPSFWP